MRSRSKRHALDKAGRDALLSLEGNLEQLVRIPVDVRIGTRISSTKIPALSPIAHGWQGKIAFLNEHPHASLAGAANGQLRKA